MGPPIYVGTGELPALCVATWDTIVFTRVLSFFFFLLLSPHPSLQPHTVNSWKQKLLGSALVTQRRSGKLSGSLLGPSIPLIYPKFGGEITKKSIKAKIG